MTITLSSQSRDPKASLEALRAEDLVPAVYYGAGVTSTPIAISHKEMVKIYKQAGGSSLIALETPVGVQQTLIHDIHVNPVTHKLMHVDFLVVDVTKPVDVKIPLVFIGEAPAEKQGLGVLTKTMHEIEISVPPTNIPHELTIDVSSLLTLEDNIYAGDIKLPESAELITGADVIIVTVSEVREEKEETGEGINFDAIEVEKKGKKEEAEVKEEK
jgi:large subunit ribosomal protein L25